MLLLIHSVCRLWSSFHNELSPTHHSISCLCDLCSYLKITSCTFKAITTSTFTFIFRFKLRLFFLTFQIDIVNPISWFWYIGRQEVVSNLLLTRRRHLYWIKSFTIPHHSSLHHLQEPHHHLDRLESSLSTSALSSDSHHWQIMSVFMLVGLRRSDLVRWLSERTHICLLCSHGPLIPHRCLVRHLLGSLPLPCHRHCPCCCHCCRIHRSGPGKGRL